MKHISDNPVLQWITIIIAFLIVVFFYVKYTNDWDRVRADDRVELFGGWSEAKLTGISGDDWEDGAYISDDGSTLYYTGYPGDLLNDMKTRKFKADLDIYYSMKPFNKSEKHTISEDIWSEGGVMFAGSDVYYMSNRNSSDIDNLYKNGQRLDISNPQLSEQDPHYCLKLDELYFWADDMIYVAKDDKVSVVPAPINDGSKNIQPFLTEDCRVMYFASTRGEPNDVLKIYKSQRHEKGWQKPELVARSKYGVGEPTLTRNNRMLFFVQVFKNSKGDFNSDILYTELDI